MKSKNKEDLYHKELDTLLRFSAVINSSLKLEEVLDIAMKWAEEFMDAEASSVYELDEESNLVFIRLARGEKKATIKGFTLNIGEGVAGYVVQTGKPLVIQDVRKEHRFSDKFDKATGFNTRALISVPLILRDKPIGVLQVINKKSDRPFTDNDLELLTGMAQQIAVAMENAKLYRRLEEKFELTAQELKFTQDKLIRAGRLAAMGNLVQGVAHEIRNPVTTIGGFAKRIKKELDHDGELAKYIDIIMDESARLENIVTKVRELSEIQSADLQPGDIAPILEESLGKFETMAKKQGVRVTSNLQDDLPTIRMDGKQLVIALSNIIENALEAMPRGGTLHIEILTENDTLIIRTADTGCGIEDARMDAVYDPFVTSKTRGAGLGLTMVHQIVMNHNGEIDISSELEKGTVITIRLPLDRESLGPESP